MRKLMRTRWMRECLVVLFALVFFLGAGTVSGSQEPQQLAIVLGESRVLPTTDLERVAVANPAVADVVVASVKELIVNAKAVGVTTLHVWDRDGRRTYIVKVHQEDSETAAKLSEAIGLPGVTAKTVDGTIFLEGRADRQGFERAEKVAKAFGNKVVNLIVRDESGSGQSGANAGQGIGAATELEAKTQAAREAQARAEAAEAAAKDEETRAKAEEAKLKAEEARRKAEELEQAMKALPERVKARSGLPDLKVHIEGQILILDGTAPTQQEIDRTVKLAQALGSGLVRETVSLLTVAPADPPQVLLQVQVVEIFRDALNTLGITWGTFETAESGLVPGSMMVGQLAINGPFSQVIPLSGRVEALVKDGTAKLLAAPSLLAISGKPAEFLAGGEIPIPVPEGDRLTIYFKEYGVKLKMLPEVRPDQKIMVHLRPEVSTLDWANGAKINNALLPALKTRRAETDVRLVEGETLIIGGLLSSEEAKNVQGVPLLAKLPIIGKIFGSDSFKKGQTELLIFVTPRLVRNSGDVRPEMITKPAPATLPDGGGK